MYNKGSILFKILAPFIGTILFTISIITSFCMIQQKRALSTQQGKKALIFSERLAEALLDPLSFQLTDKLETTIMSAHGAPMRILYG